MSWQVDYDMTFLWKCCHLAVDQESKQKYIECAYFGGIRYDSKKFPFEPLWAALR